jgi:hypothetical protein
MAQSRDFSGLEYLVVDPGQASEGGSKGQENFHAYGQTITDNDASFQCRD